MRVVYVARGDEFSDALTAGSLTDGPVLLVSGDGREVPLARGDGANFVDAVVSGMLVDGPVLLTPGTCEPVRSATAAFLGERTPEQVTALGGSAALCTSTLRGAGLDARPPVDCAQTRCVAFTFDDGPSSRPTR